MPEEANRDDDNEYTLFCNALRQLHTTIKPLFPTLTYDDLFFEIFGCYPNDTAALAIGRGRIRSGVQTLNGLIEVLNNHAPRRAGNR